jgi:hypothetical protein
MHILPTGGAILEASVARCAWATSAGLQDSFCHLVIGPDPRLTTAQSRAWMHSGRRGVLEPSSGP